MILIIFANQFFPSNDDRKRRIDELSSDCSNMIHQLASDKDEIDTLLYDANNIIIEAYAPYVQRPIQIQEIKYNWQKIFHWSSYVADILTAIFVYPEINAVMLDIMAGHVLKKISVEEANVFTEVVMTHPCSERVFGAVTYYGVPVWMRIFRVAGNVMVMGAAVLAVDAAFSLGEGYFYRDRARQQISVLVSSRLELKRKTMISSALKSALKSIMYIFLSFKRIEGIKAEDLDSVAVELVKTTQLDVDDATEQRAALELATLDSSRSSWTEEDHYD